MLLFGRDVSRGTCAQHNVSVRKLGKKSDSLIQLRKQNGNTKSSPSSYSYLYGCPQRHVSHLYCTWISLQECIKIPNFTKGLRISLEKLQFKEQTCPKHLSIQTLSLLLQPNTRVLQGTEGNCNEEREGDEATHTDSAHTGSASTNTKASSLGGTSSRGVRLWQSGRA